MNPPSYDKPCEYPAFKGLADFGGEHAYGRKGAESSDEFPDNAALHAGQLLTFLAEAVALQCGNLMGQLRDLGVFETNLILLAGQHLMAQASIWSRSGTGNCMRSVCHDGTRRAIGACPDCKPQLMARQVKSEQPSE